MSCFPWRRVKETRSPDDYTDEQVSVDEYIQSEKVVALHQNTFKPYLKHKTMVLVMFYHPKIRACESSKEEFKKAAEKTKRDNHAYAAVNCETEHDLCCAESVKNIPVFKLYTLGKYIGFNDTPRTFLHKDMQKWVEKTKPLSETERKFYFPND